MNKFVLLYSWFIRSFLYFLPDMPLTMRLRGFLYGLSIKKCGKNFQVANNVYLKNLLNLEIGNNVFIGNNSMILGSGQIIIEDEVLIGPNVVVISGSHTKIGKSYRYGQASIGTIILKRGSWVTSNCTIVKDSKLPEGSVLGANSVLNKIFDIEEGLYAGSPAKFIKKI